MMNFILKVMHFALKLKHFALKHDGIFRCGCCRRKRKRKRNGAIFDRYAISHRFPIDFPSIFDYFVCYVTVFATDLGLC